MTRGARFLTTAAGVVAVLLLGSGLLLAASVATSGLVDVRVEDEDTRVHLPVPAVLLEAGIGVIPLVLPAGERSHLHEQLGQGRGEAALAMLQALEGCPDAVLVDVVEGGPGGDHVQIAKHGRDLVIQVRGDGKNVDLSFPSRLLPKLLHAVGA